MRQSGLPSNERQMEPVFPSPVFAWRSAVQSPKSGICVNLRHLRPTLVSEPFAYLCDRVSFACSALFAVKNPITITITITITIKIKKGTWHGWHGFGTGLFTGRRSKKANFYWVVTGGTGQTSGECRVRNGEFRTKNGARGRTEMPKDRGPKKALEMAARPITICVNHGLLRDIWRE